MYTVFISWAGRIYFCIKKLFLVKAFLVFSTSFKKYLHGSVHTASLALVKVFEISLRDKFITGNFTW